MFLEPTRFARAEVELDAEERHYLITVRRCQHGDVITVFDGVGSEADARLSVVDSKNVSLRLTARRAASAVNFQMTLACALLKGPKMDWVVQKATELGVTHLRPVCSARSVARSAGGNRLQRWHKIAREAARQCGRSDVPSIAALEPLEEVLNEIGQIGKQDGDSAPHKWVLDVNGVPLASIATPANFGSGVTRASEASVVCLVGPEGGFSESERALIVDAGFQPVRIAQYTLRAETAAIAVCAAVAILASSA